VVHAAIGGVLELLHWVQPESFEQREISQMLSYDGQVYFECIECREEVRFNPRFSPLEPNTTTPCNKCGGQRHRLKRHLLIIVCRCHDHDHEFIGETDGTELLQCPNCGSPAVTREGIGLTSPFPASFGQGYGYSEMWLQGTQGTDVESPQYQWGISASADIDTITWELGFEATRNDYPLYLPWAARFCNRLREGGHYSERLANASLTVTEAALWHEHCRSKRGTTSGLRALRLHQLVLAEISSRDLRLALCQHNISMVLSSLLNFVPEKQLGPLVGIRMVRSHALALSESALTYFENDEATIAESEQQRTVIQATITDLLKIRT
jgi:Zn finger protein HypA/HybF involved in hydrogenase expression